MMEIEMDMEQAIRILNGYQQHQNEPAYRPPAQLVIDALVAAVIHTSGETRDMFRWTKTHGCDCCPIPEHGEKYVICVGALYGGIVQTTHNPYNRDDIGWEAQFHVAGKSVTGQSGGGMTRDEGMAWVEQHILQSIQELRAILNGPHNREIYDALVQFNDDGTHYQERVQ